MDFKLSLKQVEVEDDPYFTRDGSDVHIDVPISISQAILGGVVTVPSLFGEFELKVCFSHSLSLSLKFFDMHDIFPFFF